MRRLALVVVAAVASGCGASHPHAESDAGGAHDSSPAVAGQRTVTTLPTAKSGTNPRYDRGVASTSTQAATPQGAGRQSPPAGEYVYDVTESRAPDAVSTAILTLRWLPGGGQEQALAVKLDEPAVRTQHVRVTPAAGVQVEGYAESVGPDYGYSCSGRRQ
jgi:hypothetical protein